MDLDPKPGQWTTEWYGAIVHALFALAVILGVVTTVDAARLEGSLAVGISAVAALITTAQVFTKYIKGRNDLKTQLAASQVVVEHVVSPAGDSTQE